MPSVPFILLTFPPAMFLLAVHINDNLLAPQWCIAGFAGMALLAVWGAWRLHEDEIPRVALLTATTFVASSIVLPLPGPIHTHLLLNGLAGVLLGRRSALAIPVGVGLQAVLLGHGGYSTIGITSCVMTLPALFCGQLFHVLKKSPWLGRPWFQFALAAGSTFMCIMCFIFSLALLSTEGFAIDATMDHGFALRTTFQPLIIASAVLAALTAGWLERKWNSTMEFPLGLIVGELSVLLAVVLDCLVLIWGGEQNLAVPALVTLIVHIPIAVVEGVVLGFTVGFLARVKPEMLEWRQPSVLCMSNQNRNVPCSPK